MPVVLKQRNAANADGDFVRSSEKTKLQDAASCVLWFQKADNHMTTYHCIAPYQTGFKSNVNCRLP